MDRFLWLVFERIPHPAAVSYPATERDAQLVLELLVRPRADRLRFATHFKNYLNEQSNVLPSDRPSVPCRTSSGSYVLVPWRLARWFSSVLPADDALAEKTAARIRNWLQNGDQTHILTPDLQCK